MFLTKIIEKSWLKNSKCLVVVDDFSDRITSSAFGHLEISSHRLITLAKMLPGFFWPQIDMTMVQLQLQNRKSSLTSMKPKIIFLLKITNIFIFYELIIHRDLLPQHPSQLFATFLFFVISVILTIRFERLWLMMGSNDEHHQTVKSWPFLGQIYIGQVC